MWRWTMLLQRDKLGLWDHTHLHAGVGFFPWKERVEKQGAEWFRSSISCTQNSLSIMLCCHGRTPKLNHTGDKLYSNKKSSYVSTNGVKLKLTSVWLRLWLYINTVDLGSGGSCPSWYHISSSVLFCWFLLSILFLPFKLQGLIFPGVFPIYLSIFTI